MEADWGACRRWQQIGEHTGDGDRLGSMQAMEADWGACRRWKQIGEHPNLCMLPNLLPSESLRVHSSTIRRAKVATEWGACTLLGALQSVWRSRRGGPSRRAGGPAAPCRAAAGGLAQSRSVWRSLQQPQSACQGNSNSGSTATATVQQQQRRNSHSGNSNSNSAAAAVAITANSLPVAAAGKVTPAAVGKVTAT